MQWSGDIYFLVFLFLPTIENAVISIDGSIDLGPHFQIEYSLAPLTYDDDDDRAKRVRQFSKTSRRPAHKDRQRKKKRHHKYLRDDENTSQKYLEEPFDVVDDVTPSTVLITMLNEETTLSDIKTMVTEIPETEAMETEIPETEATETEIPETEATETENPETEATETEIPETEATETETPETEATVTEIPETEATEAETPETEATETEIPETEATEVEVPETEATETEIPETEATETEIPETEALETYIPEITPEWMGKWFTRSFRPRTTRSFDVTRYHAIKGETDSKIFVENHKVKDVVMIKDFSVHILRQTLQVFETIKNKVEDNKTKKKVDFLSRIYKKKFSDFVRETQNHNVRTRLGVQKVVLNTIDTSNSILRRLINYFVGINNKNPKLSAEGIGNVVETELRKEIDLEYKHACKKFGICRSAAGFQQFLLDVMNELLKNDNTRLRKANDALTDHLKQVDMRKIVDPELKKNIDKAILRLELMETANLKPMYAMLRNAIALKNKPISVMIGDATGVINVNKTVALLDIIDTLDVNIKPNQENVMVWTRIKNNLSKWTAGKIDDSYPIIKALVKHIMGEINEFNYETVKSLNKKLMILMADVERMGYDYQ